MSWPFVYFAGDRLSGAELASARLDGDVVELGDAFMPADAVETRELRAASLRPLIPECLALTRESAAWVHGALGPAPARHTVQRASAIRPAKVIDARLVYRDQQLEPGGAERISGVWVTTPERTLADLVCAELAGDSAGAAIAALAAWRPGLSTEALQVLERGTAVHHKRAAMARLRQLAAEELIATLRTR
ncbi:MAG: SAM-dependent methyltransferase [Microbacterium sp.]|nr:MAG: SAM-dependent methyltransferase [Microbacterium sp.]